MITLTGDPESVASLIFAIGDGLGLQLVSDPEWARETSLDVATDTARHLLRRRRDAPHTAPALAAVG